MKDLGCGSARTLATNNHLFYAAEGLVSARCRQLHTTEKAEVSSTVAAVIVDEAHLCQTGMLNHTFMKYAYVCTYTIELHTISLFPLYPLNGFFIIPVP